MVKIKGKKEKEELKEKGIVVDKDDKEQVEES